MTPTEIAEIAEVIMKWPVVLDVAPEAIAEADSLCETETEKDTQ